MDSDQFPQWLLYPFYGAFTLPDTATDTKPKKKTCIELCEGVHTAQRQTSPQIHIGHCSDCIGLGLGVGVGVRQCERTMGVDLCPGKPVYCLRAKKGGEYLLFIQNLAVESHP